MYMSKKSDAIIKGIYNGMNSILTRANSAIDGLKRIMRGEIPEYNFATGKTLNSHKPNDDQILHEIVIMLLTGKPLTTRYISLSEQESVEMTNITSTTTHMILNTSMKTIFEGIIIHEYSRTNTETFESEYRLTIRRNS